MTTVEIDIEKLGSAITEAEGLAERIDSQRHLASSATPIGLPSLSDGTLGKAARWLRDNLEELQTRRDLAITLDRDDTGHASYEVSSDSLSNVQELLGQELSKSAEDLGYEPSSEDVERFSSVMSRWQNDPEVMNSMYLDLGAAGVVGVMSNIDAMARFSDLEPDAISGLAERLRSGLSTASESSGFPGESFGRELVRYAVPPLLTEDDDYGRFQDRFEVAESSMNGANILTFLLQDHSYSDQFLLGAGRQLDEFERESRDSMIPAQDWYKLNSVGTFDTGTEPGTADDPMAAVMHNFGDNPEAGLEFFTEDTVEDWNRQSFYFNDREWKADGYGGISHAAEGIGTSEANLTTDPEATRGLVSRYLDQVANSDGFNPDDAKPASPYVADLLKFYMPAVDQTLNNGVNEGVARTMTFELDHFGKLDPYPVIFKDDLDSLMRVSMSTQDGMTSIAEGAAAFQQTQLHSVSAGLAENPDDPDLRSELRDMIQRSARLQGFGEYSVGQVEIEGAENRDAQRQAYINLVGSAAEQVPLPGADLVGDLGAGAIKFGYSQAVDLGTNAAGEEFTSQTESVRDNAEERADAASTRVKISTVLSLVDSGVIPPEEVPDSFYDRGLLVSTNDIKTEQLGDRAQQAMNGVNDYASTEDIEGAFMREFQRYYGSAGD